MIRLAGPDRYATASAVALHFFTSAGGHVYVASGINFPDGLAGAPAEAANHAPLLLVTKTAIPVSTATALTALAPSDITILGGPVVVSAAVESALAAFVGGDVTKVHRIFGADRYETALNISIATFGAPPYTVFVATGTSFPDALAGAVVAGHTGGPIILVGASLTTDEQAEMTRLMTSADLHPGRPRGGERVDPDRAPPVASVGAAAIRRVRGPATGSRRCTDPG